MGRRRYYGYHDDSGDGCFTCLSLFAFLLVGLATIWLAIIWPGWLYGLVIPISVLIVYIRARIENSKNNPAPEFKPSKNFPLSQELKEIEPKLENNYYNLRNSETEKIEHLFDKLEGMRSKVDSSDLANLTKLDRRIDECLLLWELHWEKQGISPPPVLKNYLDREIDLIKENGFAHVRDFIAGGDTWHVGPRGGIYRYVNGRKRYDG